MKLTIASRFLIALGVAVLIGGCMSSTEEGAAATEGANVKAPANFPLRNTVWVPVTLANQGGVTLHGDTSPWFEIYDAGKVFGNSGVNRFSTQATMDEEKGELSFAAGITTLMAGPDLGYEQKFTETINAVRKYSISGDILSVYDADGKLLGTFRAGSDDVKKKK